MKKLVKESLYDDVKFKLNEDSFDEQEYLEDDEDDDESEKGSGEKGKSFGEQKVMELIQKYLPFLPNPTVEDYGDRDNENVSYSEDENFAYWDVVDIDCPELEEAGTGCTMIIGVPKGEEFNSDSDVTVKFYTDSVAFVGDYSDDEYTDWVEPMNITAFNEGIWEETLKAMMEYHGLEEDEEDDMWDSSSLAECKNCQEELDEHEVEEGSGYCAKCRQFDKQVYDRNKNNPNRKI